jgi:hypothetical protein
VLSALGAVSHARNVRSERTHRHQSSALQSRLVHPRPTGRTAPPSPSGLISALASTVRKPPNRPLTGAGHHPVLAGHLAPKGKTPAHVTPHRLRVPDACCMIWRGQAPGTFAAIGESRSLVRREGVSSAWLQGSRGRIDLREDPSAALRGSSEGRSTESARRPVWRIGASAQRWQELIRRPRWGLAACA